MRTAVLGPSKGGRQGWASPDFHPIKWICSLLPVVIAFQWLFKWLSIHVSAFQGLSSGFAPQKGGRQGRMFSDCYTLGGLVICTAGQWLSFIFECLSVIVKGFQGLSSILHLKGGTYAKGGRLLIFIS